MKLKLLLTNTLMLKCLLWIYLKFVVYAFITMYLKTYTDKIVNDKIVTHIEKKNIRRYENDV